jgi:hypothetical protein
MRMSIADEARWFEVCAPSVVSEVIDGEAVIMDLRSGTYYSACDTGALAWSWIEQGCSDRELAGRLAARFAVAADEAGAAVAAFIAELLANDLIRQAGPGPPVPDDAAPAVPAGFIAPALTAYTDMQDLLLLDPIHDVDEVGWPTRRDTAAG